MKGPRNTRTTAAALTAAAVVLCLLVLAGAAAALGAADATPPTGSVSGLRSPAAGALELRIYASDEGSGLANAEAQLDGAPPAFVRLGSGECPERPAPGTEPPAGACPESVSKVPLALDTRAVADGERPLRVKVTDGAGNTATLLDRMIAVRNAPSAHTGPTATVTVGLSAGEGEESPPDNGKGPGNGKGCENGKACEKGKGGEKGKGLALKRKRCRAPHLVMHLAKKPLWHTRPRHVPVLWYGRRYPYRGKLTCRSASGKRFLAPRGTPVEVYFRVWHLSFKRRHGPVKFRHVRRIKVGRKGRLNTRLGFKSGRTVLFRYHGPLRELAKAKLRLAIPPASRKAPWGPR
jgi:hypothetical protein